MQLPLQVLFRNMPPSEAVEDHIRKRVEQLSGHSSRIISCRVVVEAETSVHRKGKLYHVGIDLTVPGREIVANRHGPKNHAHEDVLVAVRDAFDAARRQLDEHLRRTRGDTGHGDHPVP